MNQISPYVNSLIGTTSSRFHLSLNTTKQWLGHCIEMIRLIPQTLQNKPNMAIAALVAANALFILAMSPVLDHMDNRLEKKNLSGEQRTFKYILLNGAALGCFAFAFNAFISKRIRYPLTQSNLACIVATIIAIRIILNKVRNYFTKKEPTVEKEAKPAEMKQPKLSKSAVKGVKKNQKINDGCKNQTDENSKKEEAEQDKTNVKAPIQSEAATPPVLPASPKIDRAQIEREGVKIIDVEFEKTAVSQEPILTTETIKTDIETEKENNSQAESENTTEENRTESTALAQESSAQESSESSAQESSIKKEEEIEFEKVQSEEIEPEVTGPKEIEQEKIEETNPLPINIENKSEKEVSEPNVKLAPEEADNSSLSKANNPPKEKKSVGFGNRIYNFMTTPFSPFSGLATLLAPSGSADNNQLYSPKSFMRVYDNWGV